MSLVEPVYKITPYTERIIEFKGLNKNAVVAEGELRDMKNMTSDGYPCLTQREARGSYTMPQGVERPISMMCKYNKLALLAEKQNKELGKFAFYYDAEEIPQVRDAAYNKGIDLDENTIMVAINTKICFFPQKIYYSLIDESVGNLDCQFDWPGALLTETGDGQEILFDYDSEKDISVFDDLEIGDAINLNCKISIQGTSIDEKPVTIGAVIQDKGFKELRPYITIPSESFLELAEEGKEEGSLADIYIDKGCPDLDYVMEYNNRLWGVSNADNTIYACKLGDPRNWQYFQNTSLDSYYAEQGTDGEWTGLAPYSGHMLFFKEKYIHKVYGTSPSTYQIATAEARGVEEGSSKSVAIINDTVVYKSPIGIVAYDGGNPYLISSKFGNVRFKNVVAGTDGIKYYASILKQDSDGNFTIPDFVVCDLDKGFWHKSDALRIRDFCPLKNELLFINEKKVDYYDANKIYIINANEVMEIEKKIKWMVEIGPFDEYIENKKVYSKLSMRLIFDEGADADIYISVDDEEWEQIEHVEDYREKVLFVPIVPRRCNRFSIKLEGVGRCRIESLTRKYRQSSGGML